MNGLGSDVTQILRHNQILRGFDDDIRTHLQTSMEQHGIHFLTGTEVKQIEKTFEGTRLVLSGCEVPTLEVDAVVLFAIGRIPYTQGLGLENAGVRLCREAIAVNEYSQTNQPHIFAVGIAPIASC